MSQQTKTLVVKYLPRGERSNTKKILDQFKSKITNSAITEIDLAAQTPDMFLSENLMAYIKRDYLKQELGLEEKKLLSKMDVYVEQVKSADIVIVAYPMFNLSMPAVVKAWFDSILLKDHTWSVKDGNYCGLMQGKKALTIVSCGTSFETVDMKSYEHAISLSTAYFQFMGFSEVKGILADGMNGDEGTKTRNVKKAFDEAGKINDDWYH